MAHATARYGRPADGWLDLSTGINPHPYPVPSPLAAEGIARLPARDAHDALIAAARAAWSVSASAALVAVPGTEIALRLLPLLAPPGAVAVVGPTYGSHGEAWRAAGRTVIDVAALADIPDDTAAVVLANPNNPDGRLIGQGEMADLLRRRSAGLTVVDEAFIDLAQGASVVPRLDGTGPVVVLRSFGKFYGLAGMRLGFVAGDRALAGRLEGLLGDWPVSSAALAIGRMALADSPWADATRVSLRMASARLGRLLANAGLAVTGGTDLYTLVADPAARAIHEGLARAGIWTRIFPDRPAVIRFGLPGDDRSFARLEAALAALR